MEKRMRLCVMAALLLLLPVKVSGEVAAARDTLQLTLDDCVRIALNESPTIKVAEMEITRVDYSRKETLGALLPTVEFTGNYNRTLAKQTMYMNFGGQNQSFKVGRDNSYTMGFSASMPLVAPQLWKSLQLSDNQILQNVENARASRLALVNQVQKAYYGLLYAEDSRAVLEENHATAQLNADIYKKKFANGTASEYDVLRSSVQVKNIEPSILEVENTIRQAKLQLKLLMGMDMGIEITTQARLADYQGKLYANTLSIGQALDQNSELRTMDLKTDYLKKALEVQKASWYPTLAAVANYNWNSLSDGAPLKNFQWTSSSIAGLSLSIPLFQGMKRYNKQKQAEISLREMTWQRENLERSLKMQVQVQFDNLQKSVKQITTNEAGVEQAVKANQIMEKSFRIGAASYLDLRDSENALMAAKLSYYQSIFNYLTAESDLRYVLGNTDLSRYVPIATVDKENNKK